MKRRLIFFIILSALGLSPLLMLAQPPPPPGDERRGFPPQPTPEMKEQFRQRIGINEQQQEQMDAIFKETFQKRRDLGKKLGELFEARQKVCDVYELDKNQLRKVNAEIQKVQGQILALHVETEEKMRRLLNKDQFARLILFRAEGRKKWLSGAGHWRGKEGAAP